jgi:hypothetical protein
MALLDSIVEMFCGHAPLRLPPVFRVLLASGQPVLFAAPSDHKNFTKALHCPGAMLRVIGYSFSDEHINRVISFRRSASGSGGCALMQLLLPLAADFRAPSCGRKPHAPLWLQLTRDFVLQLTAFRLAAT